MIIRISTKYIYYALTIKHAIIQNDTCFGLGMLQIWSSLFYIGFIIEFAGSKWGKYEIYLLLW